MTSFVAWVGVDSRGPASLHLASDSRISWADKAHWDCGRKLFACSTSPHIFGYVGDVLFPSLVLGQIAAAIETEMYKRDALATDRFERIRQQVSRSFTGYPAFARKPFSIVHGTRQGEYMDCEFVLSVLSWSVDTGWKTISLDTPKMSSALWISGTGKNMIEQWQSHWDSSSQGNTSRAVFGAFCDALHGGVDPMSGGGPQLASLYRKGSGRSIGCFYRGAPYLYGMLIDSDPARMEIEWRNELFERCDSSGALISRAQKHHSPKGLGRARESV